MPRRWRNEYLSALSYPGRWGCPILPAVPEPPARLGGGAILPGHLRVLRAVLRRRFNGPRQIFNLLLLVSALLVFTDWFNGYTGYSLDLVVPILCCVALACNFIFAFLRSNFTANALVYLLMNIGIGVLPYILLFFRIDYDGKLDAHSIPWVICLILSIITFLGLVIFRGRDLKNELVKRLHM